MFLLVLLFALQNNMFPNLSDLLEWTILHYILILYQYK